MTSRKRGPRGSAAAAAALAGLLVSASASAQAPAGPDAPPAAETAPRWFETIDVNGFVSASWGRNLNDPASGANELRAFDTENGSITLDVASLVVRKEAGKPGETGFRLDALAGSSVPGVTAAEGLFRDEETGEAGDFDLLLQRLPESSHACSSEVSHAKTLKSVSGKSGEGGTAPRQAQEALSGYGSTTSRIGCSRRAQPESSVIRAEGA